MPVLLVEYLVGYKCSALFFYKCHLSLDTGIQFSIFHYEVLVLRKAEQRESQKLVFIGVSYRSSCDYAETREEYDQHGNCKPFHYKSSKTLSIYAIS